MRSEVAYYYTQMESAVLFITNADHKSFSISHDDFARGLREGEERLTSGRDIPTFIPRTYLWSRSSSSSPKPVAEGGVFKRAVPAPGTGGGGGIVDEITKEWKQLGSSWQQQGACPEGAVFSEKDLLTTRFEELTVAQLEFLHRKYKALLQQN